MPAVASKTIFYVEDDEALAHVTQRALSKRGFDVIHFPDIKTASDALPDSNFDYALLDLKVGSDTSLALISAIRSIRTVPIIVVTGYGTIRTAVQAMKLGAVDFLNKPFNIDEVVASLQQSTITQVTGDVPQIEKPSLKSIEREAIQKALDDNDGNISATAKQLKMHRRTLQRKLLKKHL